MKWLQRDQLTPDASLSEDTGLLKFATVERDATFGEARRVRVVCSTNAADRENDVIAQAGWKLRNYQKNPVVLFGHDYRSLPVAKAVSLHIDGDRLVMECEFATADENPFAEACYKLVKGGYLNAVSVGFRPLKLNWNDERKGFDFLEQELLEISWVPVPAHPMALVEARDAGIDLTLIKQWHDGLGEQLKAAEPEPETKDGDDPALKNQNLGISDSDISVDKTAEIIAALIKQGRVLSATNENKIRSAVASLSEVLSALETVTDDGKTADAEHTKEIDTDGDIELSDFSAVLRLAIQDELREQLTPLTGRVY